MSTIFEEMSYLDDIRVGDTVKVIGKVLDNDPALGDFNWTLEMDDSIGTLLEVTDTTTYGYRLSNDFSYPFWCVQLVASGRPARSRELYMEFQDEMEFQEGDWVRVMRGAEDYEMGWNNIWNGTEMDEYIGTIRQVAGTGVHGVLLEPGHFTFPAFVLERVQPKFEIKLTGPKGDLAFMVDQGIYDELLPLLEKLEDKF